jgi:hypothetical protein
MQPDFLNALAKQLYDLRMTGRVIPFVPVGIGDGSAPDDWKPAPWCSHANVDIWAMRSPQCAIVRGWVVFDLSFERRPRFHFAAYSVIGMPSGKLFDITPSAPLSQLDPFICHPGTTEEFDQLRHQYRIVFIDYHFDTLSASL